MPAKLTKIDELLRPNHLDLEEGDLCWALRDFTPNAGYQGGPTNQLIFNLKIKPSFKGQPRWYYKEQALAQAAREFSQALSAKWLNAATLVPVPPSKAMDDDGFDDRMMDVLKALPNSRNLDVRRLLVQTQSLQASHTAAQEGRQRVGLSELLQVLRINEEACNPPPKAIGLFDDVLTMGTHFKAAQTVLRQKYPDIPVYGLFIARCVWPDDSDG